MKNKHFKPWEKDFITLAYPEFLAKDICKLLNRSRQSIVQFALNNKIKRFRLPKIEINQKFGKLTVKEKLDYNKSGNRFYRCKCDCGNYTNKCTAFALIKGKTKSCGCARIAKISTGGKYISGSYICSVKQHAKLRNIKYNVSVNYIDKLFEKQNFKCALSGLEIKMVKGRKTTEITASLDRIDSSKGYIKSNVQWIHKKINTMKMDLNEKDFLNFCEIITNFNKEKK